LTAGRSGLHFPRAQPLCRPQRHGSCSPILAVRPPIRRSAMIIPQAVPGEALSIRPGDSSLPDSGTTTLVRSDDLEVSRSVFHAGDEEIACEGAGEVVVLCLEGRVAVE